MVPQRVAVFFVPVTMWDFYQFVYSHHFMASCKKKFSLGIRFLSNWQHRSRSCASSLRRFISSKSQPQRAVSVTCHFNLFFLVSDSPVVSKHFLLAILRYLNPQFLCLIFQLTEKASLIYFFLHKTQSVGWHLLLVLVCEIVVYCCCCYVGPLVIYFLIIITHDYYLFSQPHQITVQLPFYFF